MESTRTSAVILSTGDPEVDEIDMHNLPVCAIKFLVASLSAAVASPGVSAVVVDPELTLALALSHRTLRVRPRAAAVGVEASRAQHRHRAQLGQALEAPSVSGIRDENLILVTLDSTAVILSTVRHVGGNFSAVKRLHASVIHKEL